MVSNSTSPQEIVISCLFSLIIESIFAYEYFIQTTQYFHFK